MGIKCDKCEKSFDDSTALGQHMDAKHNPESPNYVGDNVRVDVKVQPKKGGGFLKYGVILLIVIAVGYGVSTLNSTGQVVSNQNTAGGAVSPALPTGPIHWHPMLIIKIDGKVQNIPPNVGLGPNFEYPVHTHNDGLVNGARLIHLENNNPTEQNMKLGYFFQIWGKKFNKDCIFDYCNDGTKSVKMFVNDQPNTDFENYFMRDGDRIVIEYS